MTTRTRRSGNRRSHGSVAIATALTLSAFAAAHPQRASPQGAQVEGLGEPQRLFAESSSVWFEQTGAFAQVFADGRTALLLSGPSPPRLVRFEAGGSRAEPVPSALSETYSATVGPLDQLLLLGAYEGRSGWFRLDNGVPILVPLPRDASRLVWSKDGDHIAFTRIRAPDSVFAGAVGRAASYAVGGFVTGIAWLPGDTTLVALSRAASGGSILSRINTSSGRITTIAGDLVANPQI
jgi:hypothetical protein